MNLKTAAPGAYLFLLLLLVVTMISCNSATSHDAGEITLTNTSSFPLTDKPISIGLDSFQVPQGIYFPLLVTSGGDTIASQTSDLNGDGKWDELSFVIDLPPKGLKKLTLTWSDTPIPVVARSRIRFGVRRSLSSQVVPALADTFYQDQLPHVIGYQRYQTDGPTWENDKVGFRIYLDGRNAIDVFGKKVSRMTPENVGIGADGLTEDNYSVMRDWGTDILEVGNSLGIGGISLLVKDTLVRLGITEQDSVDNVKNTICKVVASRPVNSILQLDFNHWAALNRDYDVKETLSIWPGTYAFGNTVSFQGLQGDETMVVGLVNSRTDHKPTEISLGHWVVLLTDDKQSVNNTWWLGLALILPKESYEGYMTAPGQGSVSKTYLAKLRVANHVPVHYFAVAGWELSNAKFRDTAYFTDYVKKLADQISASVQISVR